MGEGLRTRDIIDTANMNKPGDQPGARAPGERAGAQPFSQEARWNSLDDDQPRGHNLATMLSNADSEEGGKQFYMVIGPKRLYRETAGVDEQTANSSTRSKFLNRRRRPRHSWRPSQNRRRRGLFATAHAAARVCKKCCIRPVT